MCEENKSQNREKMINFIETYRNLPILWDRTCKDYVNRDEKSKAYNKLLLVYRKNVKEATIQDVKKKINSLRSNYRKEVRKVEHFKNYGQMYEPTCWTFQKLSFLKASKCEPSYAPRIKQEVLFTFIKNLNQIVHTYLVIYIIHIHILLYIVKGTGTI